MHSGLISSFKICPHLLFQNLLLREKLEVVAKHNISYFKITSFLWTLKMYIHQKELNLSTSNLTLK